jgi:hypothetical protein
MMITRYVRRIPGRVKRVVNAEYRPGVRSGFSCARRLPGLCRPPGRGAQTGSTLGLAPAIVVATRWPRRVRVRSGANSLLGCASNERPPPQSHSPVSRAVHAGGCRRHDRLGHRRRTDRSPVAGTSARITEMTSGPRRGSSSRLPLAVRAVPRRSFSRRISA